MVRGLVSSRVTPPRRMARTGTGGAPGAAGRVAGAPGRAVPVPPGAGPESDPEPDLAPPPAAEPAVAPAAEGEAPAYAEVTVEAGGAVAGVADGSAEPTGASPASTNCGDCAGPPRATCTSQTVPAAASRTNRRAGARIRACFTAVVRARGANHSELSLIRQFSAASTD